MIQLKYTSNIFDDIYTRKIINYNGQRLKSIYLINMVDLFINRYVVFKKDNIKLSSQILKSIYGAKYNYYIDYLIDKQFIYLYKNYSVGIKSKTYRLTDYAKVTMYSSVNVDIPQKLHDKIMKYTDSAPYISDFIKDRLIRSLYEVKIDYKKSKNWIQQNLDKHDLTYTSNMSAITKIFKSDLHYTFDVFGRFHTNFTNLKREIRHNFLSINGNKLIEIDITNSQPFFLYIFMKNKGFKDFNGFDKDVLSGKIYEQLMEFSKENNITRKEVKVNVYSVLFGRTLTTNKWHILFNDLYPEVYQWIVNYKIKNRNYKIIAQELQLLESNFIFNTVAPEIITYKEDIKFITIHDSIMVEEEHYINVNNIFNKCLSKLIN